MNIPKNYRLIDFGVRSAVCRAAIRAALPYFPNCRVVTCKVYADIEKYKKATKDRDVFAVLELGPERQNIKVAESYVKLTQSLPTKRFVVESVTNESLRKPISDVDAQMVAHGLFYAKTMAGRPIDRAVEDKFAALLLEVYGEPKPKDPAVKPKAPAKPKDPAEDDS